MRFTEPTHAYTATCTACGRFAGVAAADGSCRAEVAGWLLQGYTIDRLESDKARQYFRDGGVFCECRPKNQERCPGEGRCHGCVVWCYLCGDTKTVCDDSGCDCHQPDGAFFEDYGGAE